MTKLNKILAAALAAQLLLVAVVFASRDTQTLADPAPMLGAFEVESLTRIELRDGGEDGEPVVLARAGEGFVVESAHGYPADQGRVDELLSALAGMQTREPFATSEGRARQLEVADEAYDRKLVLHGGGGDTRSLYLGAPAGRGRIAARVGGESSVHAVQQAVARAARTRPSDWLEQPFFEVDREQLASLAIDNDALRVRFVRDEDGAWTLDAEASTVTAPPGQLLNTTTVETIARALSRLRIADVAAPEPTPEHGLDAPQATIELALAPDEGTRGMSVAESRFKLLLGADDGDHVYLRDADRPFVVRVRRSVVREVLEASPGDLFATEAELEADEGDDAQAELPAGLPGAGGLELPEGIPAVP
jgi:hypothetical protein